MFHARRAESPNHLPNLRSCAAKRLWCCATGTLTCSRMHVGGFPFLTTSPSSSSLSSSPIHHHQFIIHYHHHLLSSSSLNISMSGFLIVCPRVYTSPCFGKRLFLFMFNKGKWSTERTSTSRLIDNLVGWWVSMDKIQSAKGREKESVRRKTKEIRKETSDVVA